MALAGSLLPLLRGLAGSFLVSASLDFFFEASGDIFVILNADHLINSTTFRDNVMSKCEQCGEQNENLFEVVKDGQSRKFDSFDCAIQSMAEKCSNCGCLITGKSHRHGDAGFCCQVCVTQSKILSPDCGQNAPVIA